MFEFRVVVEPLQRLQSLDLHAWRRLRDGLPEPVRPAPPPWLVVREAPTTAQVQGPAEAWAVPGVPVEAHPERSGPAPSVVVKEVQAAVDALAAGPVSGRPVDVAAVLVLAERLRGLGLRGLAELDATGQHADAGAASAATWLRRELVLGEDAARAAVRLAGRLRTDLPAVAQAWCEGATTEEHVRAVSAGTAGLDAQVVTDCQEALLDLVAVAEPGRVRRELRERAEAVDPALGREAERRRQDRQGFYADALSGGGVVLGGSLADEDGAVLLHGLDLAVEADRRAGDVRSLPARRAAVLVQWARAAAAGLAGPARSLAPDARSLRSHLLVTCTLDQLQALADRQALPGLALSYGHDAAPEGLQGEAARDVLGGVRPVLPPAWPTGATVSGAALRRLACDSTVSLVAAELRRAGVQGPVRVEPLYVGRSSRTVTARQLAALVVRDRRCVVRGCARRPAQCQAHHVQHWLDGGATDLDNLVLLCHQHHHDHHDRGHDLEHHDGRWMTAHGWADQPP